MVAGSLEEDRSVEAHPADRGVDAVGERRERVAQDRPVARLVDGVVADSPDAVAVEVDELQVAGLPAAGQTARAVTQVDLFGIGLRLFGGLEEPVGLEAPDFADLHADVIISLCQVGQ